MEPLFALRDFLKDRQLLLRFECKRADHALLDQGRQRDFQVSKSGTIEAHETGALCTLRQICLNVRLIDVGDHVGRFSHALVYPDDVELDRGVCVNLTLAHDRSGQIRPATAHQDVVDLQPRIMPLDRASADRGIADDLAAHDIRKAQIANLIAFWRRRCTHADVRDVAQSFHEGAYMPPTD